MQSCFHRQASNSMAIFIELRLLIVVFILDKCQFCINAQNFLLFWLKVPGFTLLCLPRYIGFEKACYKYRANENYGQFPFLLDFCKIFWNFVWETSENQSIICRMGENVTLHIGQFEDSGQFKNLLFGVAILQMPFLYREGL